MIKTTTSTEIERPAKYPYLGVNSGSVVNSSEIIVLFDKKNSGMVILNQNSLDGPGIESFRVYPAGKYSTDIDEGLFVVYKRSVNLRNYF